MGKRLASCYCFICASKRVVVGNMSPILWGRHATFRVDHTTENLKALQPCFKNYMGTAHCWVQITFVPVHGCPFPVVLSINNDKESSRGLSYRPDFELYCSPSIAISFFPPVTVHLEALDVPGSSKTVPASCRHGRLGWPWRVRY